MMYAGHHPGYTLMTDEQLRAELARLEVQDGDGVTREAFVEGQRILSELERRGAI